MSSSQSHFEYGDDEPGALKIDKFDDEMLRRCNLDTMFQDKKVTIEVDVKKADPLINEHFRKQKDILNGIRDLEYVNFYEIEFKEENLDASKNDEEKTSSSNTTAVQVDDKFADKYDIRDRIFYMNSANVLVRKPGMVSQRVKRVGEDLENELLRSDEEMKMLATEDAFLTEEEKQFLKLVPRDVTRSINRFISVQQKGVRTTMKATSNDSNNDSPRGQIKKLIEHSMDLCDKTKFDQPDAIKLKTPKEIIEYSKQMLSFEKHLLEDKLLQEVTRVTTEHPAVEWKSSKAVNYNFENPNSKVKLSLTAQLDALGKHLDRERERQLALEREKARIAKIALFKAAKGGGMNRKMAVGAIKFSINANQDKDSNIASDPISSGRSVATLGSAPTALSTVTAVVSSSSAIKTPRPPADPPPSRTSSQLRASPLKSSKEISKETSNESLDRKEAQLRTVVAAFQGKTLPKSDLVVQDNAIKSISDKNEDDLKKDVQIERAPKEDNLKGGGIVAKETSAGGGIGSSTNISNPATAYYDSCCNNDNNNGNSNIDSSSSQSHQVNTKKKMDYVSSVLDNLRLYHVEQPENLAKSLFSSECLEAADNATNIDAASNTGVEVDFDADTYAGACNDDDADNDNDTVNGMIMRRKNYSKGKETVDMSASPPITTSVNDDGRRVKFLPSYDDDSIAPSHQYFCFPIKVVNSRKTEGSLATTPASKPYTHIELARKAEEASRKVSKASENNKVCKAMFKQLKVPESMDLSQQFMANEGDKTFIEFAQNSVAHVTKENEILKERTVQVLQKTIDATNAAAEKFDAFIDYKVHLEEKKLRMYKERAFFQSDKIAETFKTLVDNEERAIKSLDGNKSGRIDKPPAVDNESIFSEATERTGRTENTSNATSTFITDMPSKSKAKNISASLLLARRASGVSDSMSKSKSNIGGLAPTTHYSAGGQNQKHEHGRVTASMEKAQPLVSNIQMFMNVKVKQFERNEKEKEDGLLLSNKWFLILVTRLKANMIKQRKTACEPCLIELLTVVKSIIMRRVRLTKKIVIDLAEHFIPKEKFELNIVYCVIMTLCRVVGITKEAFYNYLLTHKLAVAPLLQIEMDRNSKFFAQKQKKQGAKGIACANSYETGETNADLSSLPQADVGEAIFFDSDDDEFDNYDDNPNDQRGFMSIAESLQSSVYDLNLFKEEVWLKL